MSKYWYPKGAIRSQGELSVLVEQARKEPIKIWIVRPGAAVFVGPNPRYIWIDYETRFKSCYMDRQEYTVEFGPYSYWSPNGECCFPYGATNNTDPLFMGYIFPNYWMAVGWALRTKTFSQAA